jgi:hypothetical protein
MRKGAAGLSTFRRSRGGSSTVEPQPSKLMTRVRFPSAAYFFFFFLLLIVKLVVWVVVLPAASLAVIVNR